MMSDPDREKTGRVMQALMQMDKIDIRAIARGFPGEVKRKTEKIALGLSILLFLVRLRSKRGFSQEKTF